MRLSLQIEGLKADIAAMSQLGDDAVAQAGERIAAALGPVATVRLLEILGQAAMEVSAQLGESHAELRVAGDDASIVVVAAAMPPGAGAGGEEPGDAGADLSARLTLRLPEQLKARIEEAADREHTSTNAWVVRVLGRAVAGGKQQQGTTTGSDWKGLPGRRLRGFGAT
jgi:hypothetical protein